jgi:hypothetical protein
MQMPENDHNLRHAATDLGDAAAKVLHELAAVASDGTTTASGLLFPEGVDYISMNIAAAGVTLDFVVAGPKAKLPLANESFYARELASTSNFVQLSQSSTDFKSYSPEANQWGTPDTITALTGAAKTLHKTYHNLFFSVGDISLQSGGAMPEHTTGHQQGRNIDIRPMRKDRADAPVDYTQTEYDRKATIKVIYAFLAQPNVSFIIFNDPYISGIQRDPAGTHSHDNHIHVQTKA